MSINKVLVVDDNLTMLQSLRNIVSDYGVSVDTANNGREAIKQALSSQPDLIFLDIIMPEMDGYETCRELKKNDKTKHIPVVFVTSKDQKADKVWAQLQGANDYITKPYTPEQIIQKLESIS